MGAARALVLASVLSVMVCGWLAAQADAFVYWTEFTDGTVGRANLDGSGANDSFITTGQADVDAVAVDGQHVYWTSLESNTVGRANLDGSGVNDGFITGAQRPQGVAVDAQHLYWSDGSDIGRANLDGTGVNQSFISGVGAEGLAVDGQHIYWAAGGEIGRANLDGSGVDQSFITATDAQSVAVDGQHIYWTNFYPAYTIGRANLDGTGVDQSFITEFDGLGVAVDGQHVYWASSSDQAIGRANLDGTGVNASFITGAPGAWGVAVDALLPPPSAAIATPANGAVYAVGQVVNSSFSCSDTGGPGVTSCLDQGGRSSGTVIDTSTTGAHTLTVTATSGDGQTGKASVTYMVAAAPTASIATPANGATYALGQVVKSSFSCRDGAGGPGVTSCLDQSGHPSATPIDTSTTGAHTLTVTATSSDGQTGRASVTYRVVGTPTASITTPANGAIFTLNESVEASFSCAEGTGGPGIASCSGTVGYDAAIDTATLGTHVFTVTATSKDGLTRSASSTYTVLAPTPVLGDLKASHSRWRDGSALAQISSHQNPPVGTTFSFTLNETATVHLVFTHKISGRLVKVKGKTRCVAQTGRNKRMRKCMRNLTAGGLALSGHIGTDKIAFDGRVTPSHKLRIGSYAVTITATNAGGESSTPQTLRFTIVK